MSTQVNQPRRYYTDDSGVSPQAPAKEFGVALHAPYTHWIRNNYHRRDFLCAVEHVAQVLLCEYLMLLKATTAEERAAIFRARADKAPVCVPAAFNKKPSQEPARRLYDELCSLAPEVNLEPLEQAMAPMFALWLEQQWLARDFTSACKDAAAVLVYDHELCLSFGGLGGGKTEEQFLSQPSEG